MDDKATILALMNIIEKHKKTLDLVVEALDKLQKNQDLMQKEIDTLILASKKIWTT